MAVATSSSSAILMLPAGPFVELGDREPIRAVMLGPAALEMYARSLGGACRETGRHLPGPLLTRVRDNGVTLERAYREIGDASRAGEPLNPDAEWLLDNFYIVEQVLREVQHDLPGGYLSELPRLAEGPLKGYPRTFALALGLIAHTDSSLNEAGIEQFVAAFQTGTSLDIGEVWAVPTMLRLGLLENLRRLAEQMVANRHDRKFAEDWVTTQLPHPDARLPETMNDSQVAGLFQALRDQGKGALPLIDQLEQWLAAKRLTSADILRREHQRQAANQVSIGNCVTSLRLLDALVWNNFFERISVTEAALRGDPTGQYIAQDFATRDRCRREIERLARGAKKGETEVVAAVLERVQRHQQRGAPARESHLGYYLIGDGRPRFEKELGYRPAVKDLLQAYMLRHPNLTYFGGLFLLWNALMAAVVAASPGPFGLTVALAVVLALPLSDLAVGMWHFALTLLLRPRVLPKLDLPDGLPADCATMIVIPTMLTKVGSAAGLLERLELHYLANPEPNLTFALLTDYADASQEVMPDDAAILQAAMEGVARLNRAYFPEELPRFFVLHRKRLWNASEGKWMGWERKRGKLQEFNRLVRGATDTSYSHISTPADHLPRPRFAITLDSDTVLPREAARRLVSVLAHPLNQPVLGRDGRRVVAGHGILQPRISFLFQTGLRSRFARTFAGSVGIDPYSAAISDVYQDLFDNGTFTGKGIYDIDAFEAVSGPAFPENRILSHDLIEGNFARCGLVTDVELFDDFPARYHAFARREHRWIRGDWQLLPWLGATVPTAAGRHGETTDFKPNILNALQRWKILDNLRRSLVPASAIVAFVLIWLTLPRSAPAWSLLVLAILALPAFQMFAGTLVAILRGAEWKPTLRQMGSDAQYTLGQVGMSIAFLANQARLSLHAIAVTLYRLFVSRKDLLEWETAAAAEQRLGAGFPVFLRAMWPSVLLGLLLAFLPLLWPISLPALLALAPFALAWGLSPVLAYWVSKPTPPVVPVLKADDEAALRRWARKTWHFFERFVTDEDHWLPPDNFQEDPRGVIAHRTSPTNIGLLLLATQAAHDFGYIGLPTMLSRLSKTFDTLTKLQRYKGHFFNWYETTTLESLHPDYVSTVDSGNLMACFLTLKHGLHDAANAALDEQGLVDSLNDTFRSVQEEMVIARQAKSPSEAQLEWAKHSHCVERTLADRTTLAADWSQVVLWLRRLRSDAGHLADLSETTEDLRRWIDAFRQQIDDRLSELGDRLPGAVWLADRADSLRTIPGTQRDDWQQFARGLTRGTSLRETALPTDATALAKFAADIPTLSPLLDDLRARLDAAPVKQLLAEIDRLAGLCQRYADDMDFHFLYNPDRSLFSIGYNKPVGRLDSAHYDLLASECRITSFLCVARGEVPRKHWFMLGRPATNAAGQPGILSWGGTMFEYLMPRLLLPNFPGTLLDIAERAAVARQEEYGKEHGVPWGISESGFAALNSGNDYMYQSFGVPGMGLKRGLSHDLVIAPYATGLAAPIDPARAASNLKALQAEGSEGAYGMHEAIDFTKDRLEEGQRRQVVKSYMAHHQGMIFLGLANHFYRDIFPRRLRAEPLVRAAELLLQERVALDAPELVPHSIEVGVRQVSDQVQFPVSRRLTSPDTPGPRTHLLSNGQYTVMMTNAGGGYSMCHGLDVTRWREDRTRDCWGQFIYLRDEAGKVWSAGHQPVGTEADRYEAVYSIDKAEIRSLNHGIDTLLEVTVSPELNAEVRRLTVTNTGTTTRTIEITTYAEIVLAHRNNDASHPAFGKLFVATEPFASHMAVLCRRRPRAPDQKPLYAVQVIAGDSHLVSGSFEYETDRARFLGRRRSPANPVALDVGSPSLSATVGPVLDPVFALRVKVRVEPATSATVAISTAMVDTHEEAIAFADQFDTLGAITRTFELAWAHCRVELRHLNRTVEEAHLFQRLAGYLLYAAPTLRANVSVLKSNRLGQQALWGHGISGDLPIVVAVVSVPGEYPLARQLLNAHTYWRTKGLASDLVLLNQQPQSYLDETHSELLNMVRASDEHLLVDKPGGVFVRKSAAFSDADRTLLLTMARVVMNGADGPLSMQLNILERGPKPPVPLRPGPVPALPEPEPLPKWDLQFANGLGGFTFDGREYVMEIANPTRDGPPAPWANVIAGPHFGCVVTESGGGYSWAENSQANRLTPWSNDPTSDPPGDGLYVRDEATGQFWSVTALPVPLPHPVRARHGHGYSIFDRKVAGLLHELRVSVSLNDPVKIYRLTVENQSGRPRQLSATLFADLVLGVWREQAPLGVVTEIDGPSGAITARNAMHPDFPQALAFAVCSIPGATATGDRAEFLGRNGSLADPAAMAGKELSGTTGAALDPCLALMGKFELQPGERRSVVFCLGEVQDRAALAGLVTKYRNVDRVFEEERHAEGFWNRVLEAVHVETPDKAFDLLANRWLLYQALVCRVWGRSAVYQSGGAFGYRDQLQDVLALLYSVPHEAREHILRSAARQFKEGDAQHWWHPQNGRGIRSRCSDDYLFLPYVACRYVAVTGDAKILDESVPFLQDALLTPEQHEVYGQPMVSSESGTLYDHCVRALDHANGRGRHGLPFIGSCDWNDGLNLVGEKGQGESVWLAWFLAATYRDFAAVAESREDGGRATTYRTAADELVKAIDANAWDGDWYTRAYFDDGTPLGSKTNDECRIDSLPQSWAILCGGGDQAHAERGLTSVLDHLVDHEFKLVKLFDPPFDKGTLQPGYIKGYVAGIRENGGQYTHAATWLVMALARAGHGNKAYELFDLMNPIRHTLDAAGWNRYKVEPYVIAADVYSQAPHAGRGGWTWYTGSASWLYRVAIEGMLGLDVRGDRLHLRPSIPAKWDSFTIRYRHGKTEYRITVRNPDHRETGAVRLEVDGQTYGAEGMPLIDDGRERDVRATIG